MAATFRGSVFVYVGQDQQSTDSGGVITTRTYKGRAVEIYAQEANLRATGWATYIAQEGAIHTLTATFGGQADEVENPSEQWSWNTEQISRDIFSHPVVAAEAMTYVSPRPAQYRNDIEQAVANSEPCPMSEPNFPAAQKVYELISRGITGYEVEFFVLRRQRNYSNVYPSRQQMDANSKLYTTSKLIDLFGVPNIVQAALPATPSVVYNGAAWTWRRRDFSAEFDGANRITETVSWVFANWSTALYEYVG